MAPVISQGVDTSRFTPGPVEVLEEPCFVFVGRLDSKRKGIGRTVQAFEQFRERNESGTLVLAGRGELPPAIQGTVDTLPDVELVGHLPHEELTTLYREATALLLLSESEALPNVVLEAMASGLPVIATPVGDVPRLLDEGRGRIVNDASVEQVVSQMETIAEDPELRDELISKSRSYIEAEHSFQAVSKSFTKLFWGKMGQ
ncbi:glycosyltransferase family 4 protein [Saliphagus sp. GCM10025308]